MVTEITQVIKVTVETEYQPAYSSPTQFHYVFTYRITIENQSENTIQLLRRHWFIHDAGFLPREVEGEGVVGVQPILNAGEQYQYVSGCNLRTEMGKMFGTYQMENLHNKKMFEVNIPSFEMIVPFKCN